jgi:hypothetical protein
MKDYTVRIRFTSPSLGNVKEERTGRFLLSRSAKGKVIFLPAWHHANMLLAATVLSLRQELVKRITWDIELELDNTAKRWQRIYYSNNAGRERYSVHEAIMPGWIASIHCALPLDLTDTDFFNLMSTAGRCKGLSPWKPGAYGHYAVVGVLPRKFSLDET